MLASECIKGRRSIRKFIDKDVSIDEINKILDLTKYSPSWKNSQSVRFYVIKNKSVKDEIADFGVCGFIYNSKTIKRANTLIVVTVVKGLSGYESDGSFSTSLEDRFENFDAGIATQTLCLSAYSLGVGSVILGYFDSNYISKLISIPNHEKITNLIAIGYAQPGEKEIPKRNSIQEISKFIL